jgi:predicted GNAT family acetyltransferase
MLENSKRFWQTVQRDRIISIWLAYVDEEPVAMARAAVGHDGMLLLGGCTLEEFRGRGLYTALVQVRARYAASAGAPLLAVQAGKQSRPILERLGFDTLGEIRVYIDARVSELAP